MQIDCCRYYWFVVMVGPISSSPACCNVTLITVLSTACGGIGLVYRLSDGRRVEQTKERVCGLVLEKVPSEGS